MTSATGERDRPLAGQTLLEVLLALALMVVVLGVAVAVLPGARSRPPGDVALDEVATVLQQVRRAAVSEGRTLSLHWEEGLRTLRWRGGELGLPGAEELRLAPPDDATARVPRIEIAFRPDGSCDPFFVVIGGGRPGEERWCVDPWTARLTLEEKRP